MQGCPRPHGVPRAARGGHQLLATLPFTSLPHPLPYLQTGKEMRKIADRDRKAAEKAAAAKAAALRDDDNVFDVSYENQASSLHQTFGLQFQRADGVCM